MIITLLGGVFYMTLEVKFAEFTASNLNINQKKEKQNKKPTNKNPNINNYLIPPQHPGV